MRTRRKGSVFLCAAAVVFGAVAALRSGESAPVAESPTLAALSAALQVRCHLTKDKQTVLVPVMSSVNKEDGVIVADSLRWAVGRYHCATLFPVAKDVMELTLTNSGFPIDTALSRLDEKQLGVATGADIVFHGDLKRPSRNDWRLTLEVFTPRDQKKTDILPEFTGNNVKNLITAVREGMQTPLKSIPVVKRCEGHMGEYFDAKRASNTAKMSSALRDAESAAGEALTIFPASGLARLCLASALLEKEGVSPDSVLVLTGDILRKNPRSWYGMAFAEAAERKKGNVEGANALLVRRLAMEPTDVDLAETMIVELAKVAKYDSALVILGQAKAANPGAPPIIFLEGNINYAMQKWEDAARAYAELERVAGADTTLINAQYYERYAVVLKNQNKNQEAASVAAKGAEKFPTYVRLLQLQAQLLEAAGDLPGAVQVAKRVIEQNPGEFLSYLQVAQMYGRLKELDSLTAYAKRSVPQAKSADDSVQAMNVLLAEASARLTAARNDSSDMARSLDDFRVAIKLSEAASEVRPVAKEPHFNIGVAGYLAFNKYVPILNDDQKRTCEIAKEAKSFLQLVQPALNERGGGAVNRETAVNILRGEAAATPFINQLIQSIPNCS